jgi:hypothetical protein
MKKPFFCIGVFFALVFLTGVYFAHAQANLGAYDGQWLMGTFKIQNGWCVDSLASLSIPEKMENVTQKVYACMRISNPDRLNLYMFDKHGTRLQGLDGNIKWIFGTNNDFVGLTNIRFIGFGQVNGIEGLMRIKDRNFQSINGISADIGISVAKICTYGFTFKGKVLTKVPSSLEAVNCLTYVEP